MTQTASIASDNAVNCFQRPRRDRRSCFCANGPEYKQAPCRQHNQPIGESQAVVEIDLEKSQNPFPRLEFRFDGAAESVRELIPGVESRVQAAMAFLSGGNSGIRFWEFRVLFDINPVEYIITLRLRSRGKRAHNVG